MKNIVINFFLVTELFAFLQNYRCKHCILNIKINYIYYL